MKVVIVGAGSGGLSTALRLHHEGIDCEVYEHSEQLRELGAGINLLPHAVKELATLRLADRLAAVGIRTHELIDANRLGHHPLRPGLRRLPSAGEPLRRHLVNTPAAAGMKHPRCGGSR